MSEGLPPSAKQLAEAWGYLTGNLDEDCRRAIAAHDAQVLIEAVATVCPGEEQHADHLRYCVPMLEIAATYTDRGSDQGDER